MPNNCIFAIVRKYDHLNQLLISNNSVSVVIFDAILHPLQIGDAIEIVHSHLPIVSLYSSPECETMHNYKFSETWRFQGCWKGS